jgi:hypothetical protein
LAFLRWFSQVMCTQGKFKGSKRTWGGVFICGWSVVPHS